MSAELAPRRTAAVAVLPDFKREADKYLDDPARTVPRPDYSMWAFRLASELGSVLQRLEAEDAGAAPPLWPCCAHGYSDSIERDQHTLPCRVPGYQDESAGGEP